MFEVYDTTAMSEPWDHDVDSGLAAATSGHRRLCSYHSGYSGHVNGWRPNLTVLQGVPVLQEAP